MPLALIVLALLMAGCGGGKSENKAQSKATPSANSSTSGSEQQRTPPPPLGVRVVDREASTPPPFKTSAKVEGPATVRRDMEAIDAVLDPVQQAKYRLLEVEVERKLRGLMAEMRNQNRGNRAQDLPEN